MVHVPGHWHPVHQDHGRSLALDHHRSLVLVEGQVPHHPALPLCTTTFQFNSIQ
jgi:hypothetical protein